MELPKTIENITLLAPYSKGGTSRVYLGTHPDYSKPLLIKIPKPQLAQDKAVIERFINEAQILKQLHHTSINTLFDSGPCDEGYFIATPFYPNTSLNHWIRSGGYSYKTAISVIYQICTAVCHIHANNLVHLDLKPANIMIDQQSNIKIIDFDISKEPEQVIDLTSQIRQLIGTVVYMSPEQQKDINQASFTSDIYTLGLIFYEILTHASVLNKVIIASAPAGMQQILSKMLQPSPQKRYQDIVDVIYDISIYLESSGYEKDQKNFNRKSRPGTPSSIESNSLTCPYTKIQIQQIAFNSNQPGSSIYHIKSKEPLPFTLLSLADSTSQETNMQTPSLSSLSFLDQKASSYKVSQSLDAITQRIQPHYKNLSLIYSHTNPSDTSVELTYTKDSFGIEFNSSNSTYTNLELSSEPLFKEKNTQLRQDKIFIDNNHSFFIFSGLEHDSDTIKVIHKMLDDCKSSAQALSSQHLLALLTALLFSPLLLNNAKAFGITLIEKSKQ